MKKTLLCKYKLLFISFSVCILYFTSVRAQNVAITDDDSYIAVSSAMLDVYSLNKGMLVPRMDSTQRKNITSPALGLLVFDKSLNCFMYHNGAKWVAIPNLTNFPGGGSALFAVTNSVGDTVFAVYEDGVRVTINEASKGKVGGFAVSGRTPTKAGEIYDYLRVTTDSTRIYINDTLETKGTVGGFAISGRTPTKGFQNNYFVSTPDSTRVYVNDTSLTKGKVGGFAVSGRTPTKGTSVNFLDLTPDNYFIGHNSGTKTSGLYNIFVGYESGKNNTLGEYNSFFGYRAGLENISGVSNVFIGYLSGTLNTIGYSNVFIGDSAGYGNTSGKRNVFIGSESGVNNTKGFNNSFIGYLAGKSNTLGRNNLFIGTNSGFGNISGDNNIFLGNESGYTNSTGEYNTFIGYKAGYISNSSYNSFIGYQAGMNNSSGQYNSFMGHNAGYSNNIGSSNVFIGDSTGFTNTNGNRNVMIGKNAGLNSNGNNNIFIGVDAGKNTVGDDNITIGIYAGKSITTGNHNLIIGSSAGYSHTDQEYNVMLGTAAGYHLLGGGFWAGSFNTFVGINAGYQIATGKENVFLGTNAGYFIENGTGNTIVGIDAGRSGDPHISSPSSDASYNSFFGDKAGFNITDGDKNVTIGYRAGYSLKTGTGNVFIGYNAGSSLADYTSDKLYIANTSSNPPLIYGDFSLARIGLGTTTPVYKLDVVGDINITGNFKINGANIVTTTIVEGDLTATGPISLSATRKVIGGAATISIANASISAKGAVQLSNAYDKFGQDYATTELALSNGLATKVTGAGIKMGIVNQLGDGEIVSIAGGDFYLYWDDANSRILIMSTKSKAYSIFCWWQGQVGTITSGETKELIPSKAPQNIIIPMVEQLGGYEIHISDLASGTFSCSLWIQRLDHRLVGHYTQF